MSFNLTYLLDLVDRVGVISFELVACRCRSKGVSVREGLSVVCSIKAVLRQPI